MIFSWNNIKILKKYEGAKEYYIYADLLMKITLPKYDFFEARMNISLGIIQCLWC